MLLGCLSHEASGLLLPYVLLLIPFGSVAAELPQLERLSHERTILAESFANEKLWYWQNRLNLNDWNVSLAVVRSTELKPDTLGNIHWDLENQTATIRVLDPADYRMPLRKMLDDIQFTVVHELIHLERAPVRNQFSTNEASRREEEHTVNHMTRTLLKLDRERPALSPLIGQARCDPF